MESRRSDTSHPIIVDCSRRLPDVNRERDVPSDLDWYGRCAIVRDGTLWLGGVSSSHPRTTATGFYVGLSGRTLFVSPRGCTLDWEDLVTAELVQFVLQRLQQSYGFRPSGRPRITTE